ncbi:MAG: dinitrogenase iron-molybdenum cofactor biosynthesis protein [Elusimicrobia bacterium]|nr:dinitrogenase iron-molybdenum cofactor biosynthesis protein [Elusimicrobiota bacterium]
MNKEINLLVAFGTDDGKNLNDNHVGKAKVFFIYKISNKGVEFIEKRDNPKFQEDETLIHGDPAKAAVVSSILKGIDVIVGKRFGPNIVRMKKKFVCVVARVDSIEDALDIVRKNIALIDAEKNKGEGRSHLVLKK